MRIILNKHIDLSNYNTADMKITVSDSSALTIQTRGLNGSLTVEGKNIEANGSILLSSISNTFTKTTTITNDGIYNFDVAGIDNVELFYTGNNGNIYVKAVD